MITVKRFWLFEYDNYYPLGGIKDHKGCFDTLEEAIAAVSNKEFILENSDIWDIQDMTLVWKKGSPE